MGKTNWHQPDEGFEEIEKVINQGQMPLWDYLLMHPQANLTADEKQALLDGLKATLAAAPPIKRQRPSGP